MTKIDNVLRARKSKNIFRYKDKKYGLTLVIFVDTFGCLVASSYHSSIRIEVGSPQLGTAKGSCELLEGSSDGLPLAVARSVSNNGIESRLGLNSDGANKELRRSR